MRILITGADGQLGKELEPVLAGHVLIPFTVPEFDLLKPEAEQQVMDARPELPRGQLRGGDQAAG